MKEAKRYPYCARRTPVAGAGALPPKITRDGLRSKFVTARSKVASAPRAVGNQAIEMFQRLLDRHRRPAS